MRNKRNEIAVTMCLAILIFFLITIVVRFFTRQILIEHYDLQNSFVKCVFADNLAAIYNGEEENQIAIDWEKEYPFSNKEDACVDRDESAGKYILKWENKVKSIESRVERYTTDLLMGYYVWIGSAKKYQQAVDWKSVSDDSVVYMDNGYLTFTSSEISINIIDEIAGSVCDLEQFCKKQDIDFFYINAGSKECPYDTQIFGGDMVYANANCDALMNELRERNVSAIDMRELLYKEYNNWYDAFYETDHHWKTETGLWAAKQISHLLNDNSGFQFDTSLFSEKNYYYETYENFWLGSQGRKVTLANAELDDYTKIVPKFPTWFSLSIPTRGIEDCGTYEDVMIDNDLLRNIRQYSNSDYYTREDAYEACVLRNDALVQIKNGIENRNSNRKILMLTDSFGRYCATYLACDVGEIDVLHPEAFSGSIHSYITQTEPDVVVMMTCERSINQIDWEKHTSMYDFR